MNALNAPNFISRKDIEAKAEQYRQQHGGASVPVNPLKIASNAGVNVFTSRFLDDSISGVVKRTPGGGDIYVNQDHAFVRQRFTIAHELGHLVLHSSHQEFADPDANLFRIDRGAEAPTDENRSLEVQANMFAAALLMPESSVREAYEANKDIDALAKMFQVSRSAMGYRIDSLGL